LDVFGATIEGQPFVHQRARIAIPWHLTLRDRACLGDRANAYSLGEIEIGARATVAQEAYLSTGTHDFSHPALQLVTAKITIGDATVNIAKNAGVQCHDHLFSSFAAQRNWAIENCGVRYPWILFLDADEASTPEFQRAVLEAIEQVPDSTAGFYCCWKLIVEDRWLKRCDSFPKWQFRLLRRGRATFVDFGH